MTQARQLNAALQDSYRVERKVGRGGMATVYLAHDVKHDRQVALKVLNRDVAASVGAERFLQEIKIAARLSHPHILPLHDSGNADGLLFYVMPYVEGESLAARLRRDVQLSIEDAIAITSVLASALDYAHGLSVVHRDLKPENILFYQDKPMLADFGIALAASAAAGDRITETGVTLGTPAYMSPEQASGDSQLDARCDVYSLACVVYEMLAGQPPFVGRNARAIMARHVTDPVPPLTTVRPSVGDAMARVVEKALAKVPMDRFATTGEFATALQAAQTGARVTESKSVVVLPFTSLGGEPDNQHFSDGLTEEIIADLSKLPRLRVVSRTSALKFKGTTKDIRSIGRELNVRYAVDGSVRSVGRDLRITVQLVDAASDTPLWSNKFTGALDDALELQEQVAQNVVVALRSKLGGHTRRHVRARPAENAHALECYVRAQRDIWRFTEPAVINVLQYLQEALTIVGDNVLLYAAIADAYYVFPHITGRESETCLARVEECAMRILELDPDAAHGYCALGLVEWKRGGIEGEALSRLQYALELDPRNASVLHWLGWYASQVGREAVAEECAATLTELDPLAAVGWRNLGWLRLLQGAATEALRLTAKARESASASPKDHWLYAYALATVGNVDAAAVVADEMTKNVPNNVWTWLARLHKNALQGERRKALRAATPDLRGAARLDEVNSLFVAQAFSLLGETAPALEWLENALRRGFLHRQFLIEHSPFLEGIRAEDRCAELLTSVAASEHLTPDV